MTHARMRSEPVAGRALCTTRRTATIPYPASPAPSPALRARTVQSNAQSLPCLACPSPSLLRLSGLRTSPVCPTSFALPVPSSLVSACPRCMTLRRHAAHCTFGGGLPCGSTLRCSALSSAPACCGRPARLWGTFLFLLLARSYKPPWHTLVREQQAPFPALPSLTPCPPASASTVRSNLRGNAPSLPPLFAPAPWPCPAPCLLALPHLALPLVPGCRVSGVVSLCPFPPSIPPACTVHSNVRGNPPTPSFSVCPLVPWSLGKSHPLCTAPACGLCPLSLPSLVARHFVGTLHTIPPGTGCLVGARCGISPCPEPPLAAGCQLGRGALLSFLPLVRSL